MNVPSELKYTKDHEWVNIDGAIVTVGITDFAQSELGDIVYVEVDALDETLEADAVFGTVEAVKTVSDLFLPVTGEIIAFNEALEDEPEKVNELFLDNFKYSISLKNTTIVFTPIIGLSRISPDKKGKILFSYAV